MSNVLQPLLNEHGQLVVLDESDFSEDVSSILADGPVNRKVVRRVLDNISVAIHDCGDESSEEPQSSKVSDAVGCVIAILDHYSEDTEICAKALSAIEVMTRHVYKDHRICEALVKTLHVRACVSRSFIADQEYRKGFNSLIPNQIKGCDGLWRDVFDYIYPAERAGFRLVLHCLHIIRELTRSNTIANRNSLISAGLCEIISSLLRTHSSNPTIVHECCKASIVLAHAGRDRLVLAGACRGLVEAVAAHVDISSNAVNGCRAIYSLSLNIVEGRRELVKAGACELLVNLINNHLNDKDVVREGCLAIYRLSFESPENKKIFFKASFCEALMLVYRSYGQSNEINVRGLVRDFIFENDAITNRFIELGASSVLPGLHL